jgi:hypothetical protein
MAVAILDEVQMLDQEIVPPFTLAQQRAHIGQCLRIDLPALGGTRRPPPANRRLADFAAN